MTSFVQALFHWPYPSQLSINVWRVDRSCGCVNNRLNRQLWLVGDACCVTNQLPFWLSMLSRMVRYILVNIYSDYNEWEFGLKCARNKYTVIIILVYILCRDVWIVLISIRSWLFGVTQISVSKVCTQYVSVYLMS